MVAHPASQPFDPSKRADISAQGTKGGDISAPGAQGQDILPPGPENHRTFAPTGLHPDFLYPMANPEWIEKQEQFEELITVEDAKARTLGRCIRKVL